MAPVRPHHYDNNGGGGGAGEGGDDGSDGRGGGGGTHASKRVRLRISSAQSSQIYLRSTTQAPLHVPRSIYQVLANSLHLQ